jgi:flagellin-like protein
MRIIFEVLKKMNKGISTIIATIMLVVITIGLISTAYLYFSGIVTVGPVLAIANANCNGSQIISATLRNDGTSTVKTNTLSWLLDGNSKSGVACDATDLNAGGTTTCTISTTSGLHNFLAIGPKNQAGGPVTCP